MTNFADRLLAAVEASGSLLAVGLDPDPAGFPPAVLDGVQDLDALAAAAEAVSVAIIDGVGGRVPAVKPQSAFFEQFGAAGLAALERTIAYARAAGLIVVEDVKRGDIGNTMSAYARASLSLHGSDAVTLSPYLGGESLAPMLDAARAAGQGAFVLVRTSNPGAGELQQLEAADGRPVFEHVAAMVDRLGADDVGESGFSAVGAVCALTYPEDAERLRELMPRAIFLVPGLGAQGGKPEDVPRFLDAQGRGAIVAASRSIARGWQDQPTDLTPLARVRNGAREAAERANDELRAAVGA